MEVVRAFRASSAVSYTHLDVYKRQEEVNDYIQQLQEDYSPKLVPLNLSWAILLSCFMDRLEPFAGLEITESDWNAMAAGAVARTCLLYTSRCV